MNKKEYQQPSTAVINICAQAMIAATQKTAITEDSADEVARGRGASDWDDED